MSRRRLALAMSLVTGALAASPTSAQLIPIRTVPVASGDQFRLLPSKTMAMGGVRYAVDDTLADPWSNPASGVRNESTRFLGSPTFYSISNGGGGGRSFPVAGLFAGDDWFAGATLALQQIENPGTDSPIFVTEPAPDVCCFGARTLGETFGRNVYAAGFVGRRIGTGPWSIGVGISAAQLDAMDGVDLLYAGADRIEQSGSIKDFRLGLVRDGGRDRLSLVAVHNRVSMEHDVTYVDWFWNDALMAPTQTPRIELNQDQTRTWGTNATWSRDLETPGWRIGASATVNYKDHPKIPNYSIQNIPRDPGTTWAYEVGFGFSRTEAASTFALDVALQPIWSTTWQEADSDDVVASGGRLSVGDRSIENDFFFTNVLLRSGITHRVDPISLQAGIEVRSYDYHLDQVNRVTRNFRDQSESWIEWTPTLGAVFASESFELRYAARITTGTGRPGVNTALEFDGAVAADSDFILAPEGPLTLQDAQVVTHQISISLPVR